MNTVPMSKLSRGTEYRAQQINVRSNFDMIDMQPVQTVRERDKPPVHKLDKNDRMLLNRCLRLKNFSHGKVKSVCYASGDAHTRTIEHQGFTLLVIETAHNHSRVTFNNGISNIYRDFDKLMMYIEYLTGLNCMYNAHKKAIVVDGFPIDGRSIYCDVDKQIKRIASDTSSNALNREYNKIEETMRKVKRRDIRVTRKSHGYPPF